MRVAIWFRNDLRMHDHEALHEAAAVGAEVVGVHLWTSRLTGNFRSSLPRAATYRRAFVADALAELSESLRAIGVTLLDVSGEAAEVIAELCRRLRIDEVWCHTEATSEEIAEERAVEVALQGVGARLRRFWGHTLIHRDDLPYRNLSELPSTFTAFRKAVERDSPIRAPLPAPARLAGIPLGSGVAEGFTAASERPVTRADGRAVLDFRGGEGHGRARLWEYLWERDALRSYRETRNGLLGADYSSKFSPWLAAGCLSPRLIHAEVRRYEQERIANESTYWLIFELLWRDYFRFVALRYGARLFQRGGLRGAAPPATGTGAHFTAWCRGETGVPFVDANMRELNATGFMSNRGRQNVASYLVKDLHVDWRRGAEYFESLLVDYDPASNWGNWTYVAGVGNDPREDRYFNVVSQAQRYDSDGAYVRTWVPELERVEGGAIHEPWRLAPGVLAAAGVVLGKTYPRPLAVPGDAPRGVARPAPRRSNALKSSR